jgi:aminodeoxyfutalosine deaminase
MSYSKISAGKIHTVSGEVLTDHLLVLDETGKILSIESRDYHDPASYRILQGEIIPGFVNAHCHLELSHMKGIVPTGTKLIPFITSVVKYRDFPEEQIMQAMWDADREMWDSGIMAVGDISNKTDSLPVKLKSRIAYYTFVEFFDLMQDFLTEKTFHQYHEVFLKYREHEKLKSSAVPHAPYSVTRGLFERLNKLQGEGETVSIHNQETADEEQLFVEGSGGFAAFYKSLGFESLSFEKTGRPSIEYATSHMKTAGKTLFVHNTLSTAADIRHALKWGGPERVFWVTCPNANLFIENRLPDYKLFLDAGATMCIGTDSLTSNWQLSIFEEMKTIARYQSYVSFEALLKWATLNGAKALSMEGTLGSIEVGKTPGILEITNPDRSFGQTSICRRII